MIERAQYDIEYMHYLAKFMEGKCLSKQYFGLRTPLTWMCKRGHTWDVTPKHIMLGYWCNQCVKEKYKEEYLQEIKKIAEGRGGKCLSEEYVSGYTKLKFQCRKGHIWQALMFNVRRGTWCHKCYTNTRKDTLANIKKIAAQLGGKCLSKKYINNTTGLLWRCKEGHVFKTTSKHVKRGHFCKICGIKRGHEKLKDSIDYFIKLSEKHGGKCLSENYINAHTKLWWQCKEGHKWQAKPVSIKMGTWCIKCAGKQKHTIEEMQQLAEKHRGKCLSKKYVTSYTKLWWKCNDGHKWKTVPKNIISGKWCPVCARKKKSPWAFTTK